MYKPSDSVRAMFDFHLVIAPSHSRFFTSFLSIEAGTQRG